MNNFRLIVCDFLQGAFNQFCCSFPKTGYYNITNCEYLIEVDLLLPKFSIVILVKTRKKRKQIYMLKYTHVFTFQMLSTCGPRQNK